MRRYALALCVIVAACTADPIAPGSRDSPRGSYGAAGSAANPMTAGAPPPAMDPRRRVSEQDCSQAVDIAAGNLRCK